MRTQNLPKFQQHQTGKAVEQQFLRAASIRTQRLPGQYIDQCIQRSSIRRQLRVCIEVTLDMTVATFH